MYRLARWNLPEDPAKGVPASIEFHAPSPALAGLVKAYYLYRCDLPNEGVERFDLGQIRFLLRGESLIQTGRHQAVTLPVTVTGPPVAVGRYRSEKPVHCFGLILRPLGWRAITGLDARRVAGRVLDGEALFGGAAAQLHRRLRAIDSLDAMVAEVEPFLLAQVRPLPQSHVTLAAAVESWIASDTPIEALYAATDMSPRQVSRLLNEYYGGPPKHLERRYRALRAAAAIVDGGDPRQVAERFYDQPHMIRELKHFLGHTPRSLRESADPLLARTLVEESFHRRH